MIRDREDGDRELTKEFQVFCYKMPVMHISYACTIQQTQAVT